MDVEESLRALRWRPSAEPLEGRVLGAARLARLEQKLWRWTWSALAASIAFVVALNLSIDPGPRSPSGRPVTQASPAPELLEGEALRERARLAISAPMGSRSIPEVLP